MYLYHITEANKMHNFSA